MSDLFFILALVFNLLSMHLVYKVDHDAFVCTVAVLLLLVSSRLTAEVSKWSWSTF